MLFKKSLKWGGISLTGEFICLIIFCCEIPDSIVLLLVLMNVKRIIHLSIMLENLKVGLKYC